MLFNKRLGVIINNPRNTNICLNGVKEEEPNWKLAANVVYRFQIYSYTLKSTDNITLKIT